MIIRGERNLRKAEQRLDATTHAGESKTALMNAEKPVVRSLASGSNS